MAAAPLVVVVISRVSLVVVSRVNLVVVGWSVVLWCRGIYPKPWGWGGGVGNGSKGKEVILN